MDGNIIANRLRSFRLSRKFTLKKMSQLLGYHWNTIAIWERGQRQPENETVVNKALDKLEKEYKI